MHPYSSSRPPSTEAAILDLKYPSSASVSSSESAGSPPPDSPLDRDRAVLPRLHLNFAQTQHMGPYSSCTSDYSPSPTNIEFALQSVPPTQPNVHTVPVIPTLLPMPSLASEASGSASSSDADTAKAHSEEERPSQTGPSRVHSKSDSMSTGPSSPLDTAPYDPSHPYARIYTRKEGAKRRKMWNHAHEKSLFTPQEM